MIDRKIEQFSISSTQVVNSQAMRLDATSYNRNVLYALDVLEKSNMEIRVLGELTERIFMPARFKRNYVDENHGVPFLQGSHIYSVSAGRCKVPIPHR